ncbi:MAG: amino acid--[acyl-carrier-protein] ligase [Sphingomonadaceae bacterium]|nr:amino acid--[acyl-carrier-protein] ligase [Sphingomonadaceae bacterium]
MSIAPEELAAEIRAQGLIVPTAVSGVVAQGRGFAEVADALVAAIRRLTAGVGEYLRFGAVMPRDQAVAMRYFANFPQLLGSIHCFCGSDAEHRALLRAHDAGEPWADALPPVELVLTPAACYPCYAILAARGAVPAAGYRLQVDATCFRHEPSDDPARLQSFRMQEVVAIGQPDAVVSFREHWLAASADFLARLGLEGDVAPADDPFFGRAAAVMAKAQRERELKFEWRTPVSDAARPTACLSANYHLDSFAKAFGLRFDDGSHAHSACVGFGVERIALALFRTHGMVAEAWPVEVVDLLRLEGTPRADIR